MKDQRMTLRKWYGSALTIPTFGSFGFNPFVATCMGIARSILQDALHKQILVRFGEVATASANIAGGIININQEYLEGKFDSKKGIAPADSTITAIMGIIVHEVGHFAYSPDDLTPWSAYIEKHIPKGMFFSKHIAQTIGNIVEDVYIEAELNRTVPLLSWTLEETNDIFFPEEEYLEVLEKVSTIDSAPTKGEQLSAVLSLAIFAKTREERYGTVYITQLFDMVRTAQNMRKLEDRLSLALLIYETVMKSIDQVEEKSPLSIEVLDELLSKSEGGNASHVKRTEGFLSVSEDDIQGLNQQIENTREDNIRLSFDEKGQSDSTIFYREVGIKPESLGYELDKRYMRLSEMARQRSSVNRPYGMNKNRGHHIRQLHRIATDQHIFAEPVRMNNYEPMQVMVLVDCSGSMLGRCGDDYHGDNRIIAAFKAALGAAVALNEGRCNVAVYGHTADTSDVAGETVLYRLKGFNDPIEGLSSKAMTVVKDHSTSNNRDGDAILYVGKLFTHQFKRRLLIVFSDGQPNANGYWGKDSIQHCTSVVELLRQQRIDVLSISISKDAEACNDLIYGKENNICNHDPNVIERIISRIITS